MHNAIHCAEAETSTRNLGYFLHHCLRRTGRGCMTTLRTLCCSLCLHQAPHCGCDLLVIILNTLESHQDICCVLSPIYRPCWPSNCCILCDHLILYHMASVDWGQVSTWQKDHLYICWLTFYIVEWHEILCLNWGRSLLTKGWNFAY